MKRRVLFIDRDGTILVEPPDTQQIDSLEVFEFIPGAIGALSALSRFTDYEFVMVTNQDGLGTDSFPEAAFWPAHNKMLRILEGEGVVFKEVLIDRSLPAHNSPSRKPGIGMLSEYLNGDYDLSRSFVIGDRITDVELAKNLGARAVVLSSQSSNDDAVLSTPSWAEIERFLTAQVYSAQVERTTAETSITLDLSLLGTGRISVSTGLGFFDHMLHLLASHAGFDLQLSAKGDLHVDEHHLVEDVGIALGEALKQALGSKLGIERYGFLLPMDESLAEVAIDLSGRSSLVWSAEFRREKIGDVPTEMFKHFFLSLCDSCKCALHISVRGENEHHKAEAIFKGVGRALRQAVSRTLRAQSIPSTKGVL
jgi:imidazoleglycerol-phosphate dehydratase/histidinol-phosphatase